MVATVSLVSTTHPFGAKTFNIISEVPANCTSVVVEYSLGEEYESKSAENDRTEMLRKQLMHVIRQQLLDGSVSSEQYPLSKIGKAGLVIVRASASKFQVRSGGAANCVESIATQLNFRQQPTPEIVV